MQHRGQLDAIDRLERLLPEAEGRPAFLWLHVFDAHSPYRPSREWAARYVDPDHDPRDPALPEPPRRVAWDLEARDLEHLVGLYRAEVAELDDRLARLLARPRIADAWIAFTADHGERLNTEDGVLGHETLDRACLHVPLVLAGPDVPAGALSSAPVSNRDVGRTLLDLAGFAGANFPGRNLLEVEPPAGAPRFAVARYRRAVSVEQDGWMLVRHLVERTGAGAPLDVKEGEERLFHLPSDPDGTVDRSAQQPERTARLHAALDEFLATRRDLKWGVVRESSAAERLELEALGYTGDRPRRALSR